MKYMGSKSRIAKHILPLMLPYRKNYWIEPFVGGGNIIDKVEGPRIGNDVDKYAIEALKIIRDRPGVLPKNKKDTSEAFYKTLKYDAFAPDWIKGYYGYALSFGGKFFGGWRRDSKGERDYIEEAYKNAIEQSEKLKGVLLTCHSYDRFDIPEKSLIYCDPPYKGTTKYKHDFDHDMFYNWCEAMKKLGHIIFISEYNAPFNCIWKKEIRSTLRTTGKGKNAVEKLFLV